MSKQQFITVRGTGSKKVVKCKICGKELWYSCKYDHQVDCHY